MGTLTGPIIMPEVTQPMYTPLSAVVEISATTPLANATTPLPPALCKHLKTRRAANDFDKAHPIHAPMYIMKPMMNAGRRPAVSARSPMNAVQGISHDIEATGRAVRTRCQTLKNHVCGESQVDQRIGYMQVRSNLV